LFGRDLVNAHNSLVDSKAQTEIILHPKFFPFMNEQLSVKKLDDIWSRKLKTEAKTANEPTRPVPDP
jgi:hypothetical protein